MHIRGVTYIISYVIIMYNCILCMYIIYIYTCHVKIRDIYQPLLFLRNGFLTLCASDRTKPPSPWHPECCWMGFPNHWRYRFHIFLAYFSDLCKGIFPKNMAQNLLLTYLHFSILKFPLRKLRK